MLKDHRAATMIPARDVARTGRWYEDVLGLEAVSRDPTAIAFRSGSSQLNIYETQAAGTAQHTLVGWLVDDIERTVKELSGQGVTFERYDMPGLQTDAKGVARMGDERAAWFKDPEGNILSLWQIKE